MHTALSIPKEIVQRNHEDICILEVKIVLEKMK
jgi:hypothetical protein